MGRDPQQTTIDGFTYTVVPLPARAAFRTLNRLAHALLPAVTRAIGAAPNGLGGDVDIVQLGIAADSLIEHLTDSELDGLAEALLAGSCTVVINGKNGSVWEIVDDHFQGRIGAFLRLLMFAVQTNYPDLFGKSGDALASLAAQAKAKISTSQTG